MKVTVIVVAVALLAIVSVRGDETVSTPNPSLCQKSDTINTNATSGVFGCSGAYNNIIVNWIFSNDQARQVIYQLTGYQDSSASFYENDVLVYGPFAPNSNGDYFFAKGTTVKVVYRSGINYQTSYGLSFTVSPGPADINVLTSQQTSTITKEQSGGFVYFMMPYTSFGKLFSLDVEVYSYSGLKEPSVYVSRNKVPTLEKFDYTNTTVTSGAGHETCILFVQDPPQGSYVIGVFLYGTAASMAVTASWGFNVPFLTSGVKVSKSFSGIDYYQVLVPINAAKLTFQISRQVPGGYPIAYFTEGSVPSATNYQWIADTNKQSYISVTIPNPNPAGNKSPNPGNYVFAISSGGTTSGYILQVDWS